MGVEMGLTAIRLNESCGVRSVKAYVVWDSFVWFVRGLFCVASVRTLGYLGVEALLLRWRVKVLLG